MCIEHKVLLEDTPFLRAYDLVLTHRNLATWTIFLENGTNQVYFTGWENAGFYPAGLDLAVLSRQPIGAWDVQFAEMVLGKFPEDKREAYDQLEMFDKAEFEMGLLPERSMYGRWVEDPCEQEF